MVSNDPCAGEIRPVCVGVLDSEQKYPPEGEAGPGACAIYAVEEDRFLLDPFNLGWPNYDVSLDGQRFLMVTDIGTTSTGDAPPPQIIVVQNWVEELTRLVPTDP